MLDVQISFGLRAKTPVRSLDVTAINTPKPHVSIDLRKALCGLIAVGRTRLCAHRHEPPLSQGFIRLRTARSRCVQVFLCRRGSRPSQSGFARPGTIARTITKKTTTFTPPALIHKNLPPAQGCGTTRARKLTGRIAAMDNPFLQSSISR